MERSDIRDRRVMAKGARIARHPGYALYDNTFLTTTGHSLPLLNDHAFLMTDDY